MKYFLVKFSGCYDDKFNLNGFSVMTEDELREFINDFANTQYPQDVYFGNHEFLYFDSECDYDSHVNYPTLKLLGL